ncbi:LytR/AlgR family response regulator transcription factor [Parapedobacter koreensis]|uniref:LytR/AlgR family response regulator transcription factor n=1 Tax=Parapedobacter koreensis TaxID=332977 RepID=UPI001C43646F|nr:LytTR family DNA-binding domain-containing protein [Parapedobacter koreensis]
MKSEQGYIFLKVGHRIQKITIRDILLIEGMKDYLRVHTVHGKIMTLINFAKLEELRPSHHFARVHRSFMVAIDKIDHNGIRPYFIAQCCSYFCLNKKHKSRFPARANNTP